MILLTFHHLILKLINLIKENAKFFSIVYTKERLSMQTILEVQHMINLPVN